MKTLNMNVQDVDSNLMDRHMFSWKWSLSDLKDIKKNDCKVFSCFSCSGGSTMGYKLAGYDVIGNCEIDKKMMEVYIENHHPKYPYLMDIREFIEKIKQNIPDYLKNIDILDGSPPCSSFSITGSREKGWGKKKKFREGQSLQTLDDLFFYFIEIAKILQPKIVIAENVKGLLMGNAKGYVNEIIKLFDLANYKIQLFLLNAGKMGVPQNRERVFFIARRKDLDVPPLILKFNEKSIKFGEIRTETGKEVNGRDKELLKFARKNEKYVSNIQERKENKKIGNFRHIINDKDIAPTITSNGIDYRYHDKMALSDLDIIRAQTFPEDYNFMGQNVRYICGMSVPPVMMAQIAKKVFDQWLCKIHWK